MPASRDAVARRRPIFLIGMMGTGKTTVGRALAARTGRPFFDNDEVLAEFSGRTGAEVYATEGEAALHAAELRAFHESAARAANDGGIVALAASVVDDPNARDLMRSQGTTVWLDAPTEILARRLLRGEHRRSDGRSVAWLADRRALRAASFEAAAALRLDVDALTPEAIVELILARVEGLQ